ncbi:alpha/beta fold hydrolase [Sphingomonas sp. RS2018]
MTAKPNKKSLPSVSNETSYTARPRKNSVAFAWFGATAAALVATAIFNRVQTRRAEAETPPVGKFMEVDGVRLHYVDRGTGPVVVLLHGNGVLLQDYEVSGVLPLAAERNRVLAFDRPGFGYTSRPRTTAWTPVAQAKLIAAALEQLGVKQAVVVGHSWGTMVALAMALDHPKLVSGLVLLSGYYYGTARPDVLPAALPALPGVGDLMAQTVLPISALLTGPLAMKASFAPAPLPDKMAQFPIAMTLRPAQMRAAAAEGAMMIPAAIQLSRRYDELRLPIIVMAGDGDLITHPSKHAERLARDVAQAELRVVAGQGHLLHFAVPEQVAAAISELSGPADTASPLAA